MQKCYQALQQGTVGSLTDAQDRCDGGGNQSRIIQGRQVYQPDAIAVAGCHLGGNLQREAGLAGSASPGECHQALRMQERPDLTLLGRAANEASQGRGEVAAQRLQGRRNGGDTGLSGGQ